MSSINPIMLQKQLKENAMDLQDFYKDMKKWSGDTKPEYPTATATKPKENDVEKLTPAAACDKKISSKSGNVSERTNNKIGGCTDYSAWAKFDADAECEKVDENDGGVKKKKVDDARDDASDESDELTDEIDDNLRDQAFLEKERGNKFVKVKRWDEAIVCYTKAIKCYRFDPIFYANRALCYLKKNLYTDAEHDCTMSLKLDSAYVKAYQRRAAARIVLDQLDGAEFDLLKVLDFEPNNQESIKMLNELREKQLLLRPKSKFMTSRSNHHRQAPPPPPSDGRPTVSSNWPSGDDDIILIKPLATKAPHLQSKRPLTRIKIKEIIRETAVVGDVIENVVPDPQLLAKQSKNNSNQSVVLNNNNNDQLAIVVPKTSVQFYGTWRQLKCATKRDDRYNYLKLIDPARMPGIFKDAIECDVFSDIIEVLTEFYLPNNENVYDFLWHLTEIRRFSAMVIFITDNDRNNLWKLIDHVKTCENRSKDDVQRLIERFEL